MVHKNLIYFAHIFIICSILAHRGFTKAKKIGNFGNSNSAKKLKIFEIPFQLKL